LTRIFPVTKQAGNKEKVEKKEEERKGNHNTFGSIFPEKEKKMTKNMMMIIRGNGVLKEEPFEKSITFHASEKKKLSRSIGSWIIQHPQFSLYLFHLLRCHFFSSIS
jgi:hypothetical protein